MGDIRMFDINQLIEKFNLKAFVETGTFHGEAVEFMKDKFKEIHSIEINKELALECTTKFRDLKHIHIHNGNSYECLPNILNQINTNILFWLDAHFPGADAHKAAYDEEVNLEKRLPLENELDIISKRQNKFKDVIVIDDLWLYEDGDWEWGTFDNHAIKHNMNVTRNTLIGKNSDFIYPLFKDTHDFKKLTKHQGYLIFYPKGDK
jgi:hypothetical protein